MRRTIKRYSLELNIGKWLEMIEIATAYAFQKDIFLSNSQLGKYQTSRQYRNELVKSSYVSPTGLQARQWKLALKDGFETIDRYWLALSVELRPLVARHKTLTEQQKRYAFWVLQNSHRISQVVKGQALIPTHFNIGQDEQKQARNYTKRIIQRGKGKSPRVKKVRSFTADSSTYKVFEHNGRQYISIATLTPRKRLVIPLTGKTKISGNIRVVLDYEKQRVEIHQTAKLKAEKAKGKPIAVDFGITEVMTDSDGEQYGIGFGQTLRAYSDELNRRGKKRNKLHALEKKAKKKAKKAKARRIRKFNLGRKKLRKRRRRMKRTIARQVNTGLNQLLEKEPRTIICEKLGQMRGIKNAKRFNRLVSLWTIGLLADRVAFKASARGSSRKQVNPSYTSQMCPQCGFVHRLNRKGDRFHCLFCRQAGHSDKFAAINLSNRANDPEILLWMPKERVKTVLKNRFQRRLESWDFPFEQQSANLAVVTMMELPTTVPGRT